MKVSKETFYILFEQKVAFLSYRFYLMCVLPKSVSRVGRSSPVPKTDIGETVSLPVVSGQQQVDASGGKAVTKVDFFF